MPSSGRDFARRPLSERRRVASDLLNAFVELKRRLESFRDQPASIVELVARSAVLQEIQTSIDYWRSYLDRLRLGAGRSPARPVGPFKGQGRPAGAGGVIAPGKGAWSALAVLPKGEASRPESRFFAAPTGKNFL